MSTARGILTVQQVARELDVSNKTVYRHIDAGLLRATKRGNRFYVRRAWLDAYLNGDPADAA